MWHSLLWNGFSKKYLDSNFQGTSAKKVECLKSQPDHILISPTSREVLHKHQFSSVAQSCPTLCDPMNHSTPGLPVHHQLPEFTQTHVHRVSDAIQPSHPLSSPSAPAPNPSQHRGFSNESTLCMRWPKYWSFSFSISPSKEHPGLISFRMDWFQNVRNTQTRRIIGHFLYSSL